jgi:hypothetical protein
MTSPYITDASERAKTSKAPTGNVVQLRPCEPETNEITPLTDHANALEEMRERERSMRKTMTDIEALGMSQFRECIDQIVMSVCEHGSYEMLQALDAALSEADDQVTNELRQRRDQS